jgi:hypothetical protein
MSSYVRHIVAFESFSVINVLQNCTFEFDAEKTLNKPKL